MPDQLDERIRSRLTAALDALPTAAPDPALARYQGLRPPRRLATLRGPALGFAAGVVATLVLAGLSTSSHQPRVWLQQAAGSVQQLEETLTTAPEPRPADTPEPSPPPSPVPAPPPARVAPAAGRPASAPTGGDAHQSPAPPAVGRDADDHRAEPAATPAPSRAPWTWRGSPSPSQSPEEHN